MFSLAMQNCLEMHAFISLSRVKTGHGELVHPNKIMANYSVPFNSSPICFKLQTIPRVLCLGFLNSNH